MWTVCAQPESSMSSLLYSPGSSPYVLVHMVGPLVATAPIYHTYVRFYGADLRADKVCCYCMPSIMSALVQARFFKLCNWSWGAWNFIWNTHDINAIFKPTRRIGPVEKKLAIGLCISCFRRCAKSIFANHNFGDYHFALRQNKEFIVCV